MGEQRQNSPTTLRESGKGMDEAAQKLAAEWERLKAESADLNGIFGDGQDDVGGAIRALFEVVHGLADEAFTSAAENFAEFGERLRTLGDRDEETEQLNAEILSKLKASAESVSGGGA